MGGEPREWQMVKQKFEREPPQHDDILRMLGEIVICWNNLEGVARHLLVNLCEGSRTIDVLTAQLTCEQMTFALSAAAKLSAPTKLVGEIEFVANQMHDLRNYRNDYVHGITYSGAEGGGLGAKINNVKARGHLTKHEQVVSPYDMYLVKEAISRLGIYAFEISAMLMFPENMGTPLTSPQRPVLPKLHSRNLRKVRSVRLKRPASRA
jgi:hypothetical protein